MEKEGTLNLEMTTENAEDLEVEKTLETEAMLINAHLLATKGGLLRDSSRGETTGSLDGTTIRAITTGEEMSPITMIVKGETLVETTRAPGTTKAAGAIETITDGTLIAGTTAPHQEVSLLVSLQSTMRIRTST